MPTQAEIISGRPEEESGLALGGVGSALSPQLRSQIGEWQKYGEEERALSKKYQQGFSKALQAETERWQPIADEISGQLDQFWNIRRAFDREQANYGGRSRRRRRRIRGKMGALSSDAARTMEGIERAFAEFDYTPPAWSPPGLGREPEIGTEPGLQMRDTSRPQRLATTKRPTIETDLGDASVLPEFRERVEGIKTAGLQMRGHEAATYKRLLGQQTGIYENIRSGIGTEVARARNLSWPY